VDAVEEIRKSTRGRGVDVALEMIGLPVTMKQTIESLGVLGRAVIVGLSQMPLEVHPYQTLIGMEAEIVGSNDHLLQELPYLIDMAFRKVLDTSHVVSQTIPLDAEKINQRLDDLENYTDDVRAVIVQPG
jgi:threonine dehydrogenase-like Zn-dependent dehydrogenase